MATSTDLTTIQYLESIWRDLDSSETARADALITQASGRLRLIAKNNKVDLDALIAEDTMYAEVVSGVVAEAVKRVISKPIDAPPVDQWSQAASPYSQSMTFTNPSSDLYFKNNELALVGIMNVSGRSQFGLLRGIRG